MFGGAIAARIHGGAIAAYERLLRSKPDRADRPEIEAILHHTRELQKLLRGEKVARGSSLREVLDQAALERAHDSIVEMLKDPPGPETEFHLYLAMRHVGCLLMLLDPKQYGLPAAICPVDRDVMIRLYHWAGHTGEEQTAYMNNSARFALNVGLTGEELAAEKQSERIR